MNKNANPAQNKGQIKMRMKIEKNAIYFYNGNGECIGAYYGANVNRIAALVNGISTR